MDAEINVTDIYDKNLNFLVGSGASHGLFPTLEVALKDAAGEPQTIETLATQFQQSGDRGRESLLFMHYYRSCVRPACELSLEKVVGDPAKEAVIDNYEQFLRTILTVVGRRQPMERRCNLFTTNYDGCFALVADKMIQSGTIDFVLNDGTRGFQRRILGARNFGAFLCETGPFDAHLSSVPQINLVHLHGSVYWSKHESGVLVNYSGTAVSDIVPPAAAPHLASFSGVLQDAAKKISDLPGHTFREATLTTFWNAYNRLPIVNPTKWKFYETVFEEHYYQMLRLLSYELEKPNSVLITFGFSFADEHILNLLRRSLSNPRLQVFIGCFNDGEAARMEKEFGSNRNVKLISIAGGVLNFSAFNSMLAKSLVTH